MPKGVLIDPATGQPYTSDMVKGGKTPKSPAAAKAAAGTEATPKRDTNTRAKRSPVKGQKQT